MFILPVQLTTSRIGICDDKKKVYMYMVITYRRVYLDQPGKVANPTRGQLNRENEYFPVPVRT